MKQLKLVCFYIIKYLQVLRIEVIFDQINFSLILLLSIQHCIHAVADKLLLYFGPTCFLCTLKNFFVSPHFYAKINEMEHWTLTEPRIRYHQCLKGSPRLLFYSEICCIFHIQCSKICLTNLDENRLV